MAFSEQKYHFKVLVLLATLFLFIYADIKTIVTAETTNEVHFSETNFEPERKIIRNLLKEDIMVAESLYDTQVQILMALIDLNEDGQKDIVAWLKHPSFCGVTGCSMVVLLSEKNNAWRIVLDQVVTNSVAITNETTEGFSNLLLEKKIWRWTGTSYKPCESSE